VLETADASRVVFWHAPQDAYGSIRMMFVYRQSIGDTACLIGTTDPGPIWHFEVVDCPATCNVLQPANIRLDKQIQNSKPLSVFAQMWHRICSATDDDLGMLDHAFGAEKDADHGKIHQITSFLHKVGINTQIEYTDDE
jgi:hypothetical protein